MKPTPLPVPPELTADVRSKLASELGMDPAYLFQLVTGRREMEAIQAVQLELRSRQRLRRWHLRRHTWAETWPELVGMPGAPAMPTEASQPEAQEAAHG